MMIFKMRKIPPLSLNKNASYDLYGENFILFQDLLIIMIKNANLHTFFKG